MGLILGIDFSFIKKFHFSLLCFHKKEELFISKFKDVCKAQLFSEFFLLAQDKA